MTQTIRKYAVLVMIGAGSMLAACGGCDEGTSGTGAVDGTACERDADCQGECGEAGFCVGGDTGSNNGPGDNNTQNNNTTTTNNNGTGTNGTNNGTTGSLPEGSMCLSDAECAGTCNSDGICVGGGLPDGSMCQMDTECAGFCDAGTCNGAGTAEPFPTNPDGQVLCGSEPCQCDNAMDDDGDGLIDGLDPECTGPYDNDEATFATGIPGDNKDPKWQDCFFDGNSGAGDDGCRYHTDCLTGELPATHADCSVSQECFDYCRPLTPNGCDCFGCCAVSTDSGEVWVGIGSEGCDFENIDDCQQCVPTMECVNECGRCELCYGKTAADLPADCSDGGGMTGDPCTADADCQGICGGNNTCEGFGNGGFDGDPCQMDGDCRGECGADNGTCVGYGSGGFDGDACMSTNDCRGECGADNTCTGDGSDGFDGDACASDGDCRGSCGADNTCVGYGSGGYDGDACASDGDCRGTCGADNTCTGDPDALDPAYTRTVTDRCTQTYERGRALA